MATSIVLGEDFEIPLVGSLSEFRAWDRRVNLGGEW